MNTKIFGDFNYEFKKRMFSVLSDQLSGLFKSQSCNDFTLIGNYKVGSFMFDAILLTNTDVFLVEFKRNVTGAICVNDSGWTSIGGLINSGGQVAANPWEQIREKRNVLYGLFRKKGFQKMFIKTIILFEKPFELIRGDTMFQFENHKWFLTAELSGLSNLLRENASSGAPVNFLKKGLSVLLPNRIIKEKPRSLTKRIRMLFRKWWKDVA
jgi:hypothetical protein